MYRVCILAAMVALIPCGVALADGKPTLKLTNQDSGTVTCTILDEDDGDRQLVSVKANVKKTESKSFADTSDGTGLKVICKKIGARAWEEKITQGFGTYHTAHVTCQSSYHVKCSLSMLRDANIPTGSSGGDDDSSGGSTTPVGAPTGSTSGSSGGSSGSSASSGGSSASTGSSSGSSSSGASTGSSSGSSGSSGSSNSATSSNSGSATPGSESTWEPPPSTPENRVDIPYHVENDSDHKVRCRFQDAPKGQARDTSWTSVRTDPGETISYKQSTSNRYVTRDYKNVYVRCLKNGKVIMPDKEYDAEKMKGQALVIGCKGKGDKDLSCDAEAMDPSLLKEDMFGEAEAPMAEASDEGVSRTWKMKTDHNKKVECNLVSVDTSDVLWTFDLDAAYWQGSTKIRPSGDVQFILPSDPAVNKLHVTCNDSKDGGNKEGTSTPFYASELRIEGAYLDVSVGSGLYVSVSVKP